MKISNHPTLRDAADAHTEPFIWFSPTEREAMQPFLRDIEAEYELRGVPFLLRAKSQGGCYPGESRWLISKGHERDIWIRRHLAPVIAISEVLPECSSFPVVIHPGALGDIIAAMPIFRHLGGVHLRCSNFTNPEWHYKNLEGKPYESILPLLRLQPYIQSVEFEHGAQHDLDLENWRVKHTKTQTLTASQAEFLQIREPIDMAPWIEGVVPSPLTAGKVVVARSHRYRNPRFLWKGIAKHYAGKMVFVGIPEEHADFQSEVGMQIPHLPTANLLEVAQLIAGSALFIGNQSSPCWIAMGLGHPLIQEVSPQVQDSIVARPNAQFPQAGDIVLPKI